MKILVGSEAVGHWYHGFRTPNDIDWFSPEKVVGTGQRKQETFWHQGIEDNIDVILDNCADWHGYHIASADFLYTLKVSHVFWEGRNGGWSKHMHDIKWFQENTNAEFSQEIYDIFYPIWVERFGQKKANLNVSAEEFFTKSVDRTYEHDSIHNSVAYYDRPLFESILKDGRDIMVDWSKFEALSHEKKLQLVREECYATALERIIIPSDYTRSPRAAYDWAFKKTVTSFWKGKWALWAVLHYSELYKPDVDYVGVHLKNKDKLILL